MIKTIISYNPEDLDNQVNTFEKENKVFATQTHVSRLEGQSNLFVAVLFYKV